MALMCCVINEMSGKKINVAGDYEKWAAIVEQSAVWSWTNCIVIK